MIDCFQTQFTEAHISFLCRISESGEKLSDESFQVKCEYVNRQVIRTINLFVDALLQYYQLDDIVRG